MQQYMDSESEKLHAPRYSSSSYATPPASPLLGYNDTDPLLSPSSRSGALSPRSASPNPFDRPKSPSQRFIQHLAIPPQAKRKRSKVLLLLGVTALVVVTLAGLHTLARAGISDASARERLQLATEKLKQSIGGWRDGWRWTEGRVGIAAESEGASGDSESAGGDEGTSGVTQGEGGERVETAGAGPSISLSSSVASTSTSNNVTDSPRSFNISTFPRTRVPSGDSSERFLGYLPHSGFHNQRMELQNALLLGKLLNRTVLLPPAWVGWPTPTQHYDNLAQSWTSAIALNPSSFGLPTSPPDSYLNTPANYSSSVSDFPFPTSAADDPYLNAALRAAKSQSAEHWRALGWEVRPDGYPVTNLTAVECKSYSVECRHTYKDTFLSWDFLADLLAVERSGVRLVDRWDVRERAVEELLGVGSEDVYVLSDRQVYDFKFTDKGEPNAPLIVPDESDTHWARLVSLPALSAIPHKVLLVGSLFGSGRISTSDPLAADLREQFERGLAFRNPWLMKPADEIRDRLGGGKGYVGVHARVGDGVFQRHARQNMERAWRRVVATLGVEADVVEQMWERVKPVVEIGSEEGAGESSRRMRRVTKRSAGEVAEQLTLSPSTADGTSDWSMLDGPVDDDLSSSAEGTLVTSPQRRLLARSLPLAQPLAARALTSLTCRSPLHTDPTLGAFNTPLYLATDSRSPETDLNLAIFFASFPCTFIFADFDRPSALNDGLIVESVGDMAKLVNKADGVPLGRLFLPFLEAIIAAKGVETVGTYGSTFSDFAQGGLHAAYEMDAE